MVHLNDGEIKLLKRALGAVVPKVYAPSLEVWRAWCGAPSLSLAVDGDYLALTASEVPPPPSDVYRLSVRLEDHPAGVPRVYDSSGRKYIGSPVSTVAVCDTPSRVLSVSIFVARELRADRPVEFDEGLLLTLDNGQGLLIAVRRSVLGGLDCTTDPLAIQEYVKEATVRLVIE